jgi:hypothetical protein
LGFNFPKIEEGYFKKKMSMRIVCGGLALLFGWWAMRETQKVHKYFEYHMTHTDCIKSRQKPDGSQELYVDCGGKKHY